MAEFREFLVKKKTPNEWDDNDYGVVHYREKRKLRSPPGYENNVPTSEFKRRNYITLKEGSLLKMCFKYVSQNIGIIDSLVGLPEIIGKELFTFMVNNNVFHMNCVPYTEADTKDIDKLKCLRVFNEAFRDNLLHSFSFCSVPKSVPFLSELLLCFDELTELDLSGNSLNDEVLSTFYNLQSLELLVLCNCKLSDFSMKKLTLPYRLYSQQSNCLKTLDLKDNQDISWKSVPSLFVFHSLELLNLSGTSVKEKDLPMKKLRGLNFVVKKNIHEYKKPESKGWAKKIIENTHKLGLDSSTSNKKSKINFYSSSAVKIPKQHQNNHSSVLYLVRAENKSFDEVDSLLPGVNIARNVGTKKRIIFDFEDNEDDIFMQYSR